MKKIFIGGTGRSGTTILSRWLGSHARLVRIPVESRFIVDSGGLIDHDESLTTSYSHDRARVASRRFFRMMEQDMSCRSSAPYIGFDFDRLLPISYRLALSNLREAIIVGTYLGSDFHSPPENA